MDVEVRSETTDMDSDKVWAEVAAVCWPPPQEQTTVWEIWLKQGFEFSTEAAMQCFLVQHANGPCGVIAPIQALVIQQLLHSPPAQPIDPATATTAQRDAAFVAAVAQALLRSGSYERAVLVLPLDGAIPLSGAMPQLDSLILETDDIDMVREAVQLNIEHFYSQIGAMLLLYSLVLSRGTEKVRQDTSSMGPLVGGDACCEQALVNLILTGKASNHVDADAWPDQVCPVGFLTCETEFLLAQCFTSPAYPVWVAHGGGHYSVLYSADVTVLEVGAPTLNFSDLADLPDLVPLSSDNGSPPIESEDAQLARALALSLDDPGVPEAQEPAVGSTHTFETGIPEPEPATPSKVDASQGRGPVSSPEPETAPSAKRMRNESPEATVDPQSFVQALANTSGGGEDEELARAIALSMTGTQPQRQSEEDAVVALTNMQNASAPSAVESLEEQQLNQALALSLEAASEAAEKRSRCATFVHYNGLAPHYIQEERKRNGLPPSTIALVEFVVDLLGGDVAIAEVSSPEQNVNAARKIHMVLQHRPIDAFSTKSEGPFEYLVVCQPEGSMEGGAKPRAPGKWRCRDCHLKVPPEWSAYNDEEATECRTCEKSIDTCGYCHWVTRDALPVSVCRSFDDQHAPPILKLLRRRWGKATTGLERGDLPKLFG